MTPDRTAAAIAARRRATEQKLQQVRDAITKSGTQHARGRDDQEPSWRERALNAEAALKTAQAEIAAQRRRMAILLGQIRDLEHDLSPEAAQRLATENTTRKQRLRQLRPPDAAPPASRRRHARNVKA